MEALNIILRVHESRSTMMETYFRMYTSLSCIIVYTCDSLNISNFLLSFGSTSTQSILPLMDHTQKYKAL